jgi:hypothetical protein
VSDTLRTLDALFMLACASMYFGTGWSLVLFQLPDVPNLTPSTYAIPFVQPIARAVRFFTPLTYAMTATGGLLVWGEWDTGYVWVPLVFLACTVGAGLLTKYGIFPLNKLMADGIATQDEVNRVLARWARLSRTRTFIWTIEWGAMAAYFGLRAS